MIPKADSREDIIRRLERVEIWKADKVVLEWTVTSQGIKIKSNPQSGHVLVESYDPLRFVLERNDIENECFSFEFAKELAEICGIGRSEDIGLLQQILNSKSQEHIENTLEHRGFPALAKPPEQDFSSESGSPSSLSFFC